MRICMITSAAFPPKEGIGNYVANLSKQLMLQGHEINIITRGWSLEVCESDAGDLRIMRAPYLPIPPLHVDSHAIGLILGLKKLDQRPDLLHFHSPLVPHVDVGCRSIATIHTAMNHAVEMMEHNDPLYPASRMVLSITSVRTEKKLLQKVDAIATLSKEVSQRIEMAPYSADPRKVTLIGNGVDEEYYRPGGFERDHNTVFWAGRLAAGKGVLDLMDAIILASKTRPEITFRIAGEGPLKRHIVEMMKRKGISKNIRLLGWIPASEMLKEYQTASLFLITSHYEGVPTVLLEAMSCGTACISTSVGGVPEMIEEGNDGYLIPPNSPERIAKCVNKLLSDGNAMKRIGVAARNTVVEKHSWKKIAQRYEKMMRSIAER